VSARGGGRHCREGYRDRPALLERPPVFGVLTASFVCSQIVRAPS